MVIKQCKLVVWLKIQVEYYKNIREKLWIRNFIEKFESSMRKGIQELWDKKNAEVILL